MDLTNEQWQRVENILPEDPVREDGRGRPWSDRRKVLEGVLWILRTGGALARFAAAVRAMPNGPPPLIS
jgi:transposase